MLSLHQQQQYVSAVFVHFQNEMVDSFGELYYLSINEALRVAENRDSQFYSILGHAVYEFEKAGLTDRRLKEAMERVASWQEEKIRNFPASPQELVPTAEMFIKGMSQELSEFDWSFWGDEGIRIAKDLVEVKEKVVSFTGNIVQSASEIVSNTADNVSFLTKYSKYMVIAFFAFIALIVFKYFKDILAVVKIR